MRVSINVLSASGHARSVCSSFGRGVRAAGDTVVMRTANDSKLDGFDVAAFWGFTTECQQLVANCVKLGIPWIYFDLAYWQRDRYYKVTLNDRHPNAYLMKRDMPHDRFRNLGVSIAPWKLEMDDSAHILLAGMSGKAAWSWGLKAESFERQMVRDIQTCTQRAILYRPKPSWREAAPIAGTHFVRVGDYSKLLHGSHAVVTHHSNVGVDALIAGVPVFTRHGAALPLALSVDSDLNRIEEPSYPDGRGQWAANLAYCQWTVAQMINGDCWRYFRELIEWTAAQQPKQPDEASKPAVS